ncbi:MAG: hypothetical protein QW734_08415 [Candidatus Bathyarchaeia archaeon]
MQEANWSMEWLRVMERFAEAEELKTDEEKLYVMMSDTLASIALYLGARVYRDENGFFILLDDLKKLDEYEAIKDLVDDAIEMNRQHFWQYKHELNIVDEFKRDMRKRGVR